MTDLADIHWTKICEPGELPVGERREATLDNGQMVLVIRTPDLLRACPADCPHQDTPLLDEGLVDGNVLTCTAHYWQWNLETGEALEGAEMPLPLFPVRESEEGIFVGYAQA